MSQALINEYLAELHSVRTPRGCWEAKGERDDLGAEIAAKFRKGCPRDNIVFTDDVTAELWQGAACAICCAASGGFRTSGY